MMVSVALATYNGARWVHTQLESIASQTVLPDEVVVADDASTDDTLSIVQSFASRMPLRVIEGHRVGTLRNFERALAATTGDLVFPSDQDDRWASTKLERLKAIAQVDEAELFIHDLMVCNSDLTPVMGLIRQYRLRGIDVSNHIKGCCMAVRRPLLERTLPFPPGVSHDGHIARSARTRRLVPEILIDYRVHGGNQSAWGVTLDEIGPAEVARGLFRRARRLLR
jgi:glycosyltransferase involved in cell wall biosynthesis